MLETSVTQNCIGARGNISYLRYHRKVRLGNAVSITNLLGSIFADNYELLEIAGSGGMGTVFKARQLGLDRIVAVKVLHPGQLSDEDALERFKREAQVLAQLTHKNLGIFLGYGVWQDTFPYIVMEFLEGKSLQALLAADALSWQRAVKIVIQVCDAIQFAHDAGVIHRDLKPANIFLVKEENSNESVDKVKVIDFGLAKVLSINEVHQKHTKTGMLLGTVNYVSPEQCKGQRSDHRADIYSVGCILYECLVGAPPFEADNPIALIYKHANEAPVPSSKKNSSIPAELETLLMKALEKSPNLRIQTMLEFKKELQQLLNNENRVTNKISSNSSRKRIVFAIGLAATFSLIAASTIVFLNSQKVQTKRTKFNNAILSRLNEKTVLSTVRTNSVEEITVSELEKGLEELRAIDNAELRADLLQRKYLALTKLSDFYAFQDPTISLDIAKQLENLTRIDHIEIGIPAKLSKAAVRCLALARLAECNVDLNDIQAANAIITSDEFKRLEILLKNPDEASVILEIEVAKASKSEKENDETEMNLAIAKAEKLAILPQYIDPKSIKRLTDILVRQGRINEANRLYTTILIKRSTDKSLDTFHLIEQAASRQLLRPQKNQIDLLCSSLRHWATRNLNLNRRKFLSDSLVVVDEIAYLKVAVYKKPPQAIREIIEEIYPSTKLEQINLSAISLPQIYMGTISQITKEKQVDPLLAKEIYNTYLDLLKSQKTEFSEPDYFLSQEMSAFLTDHAMAQEKIKVNQCAQATLQSQRKGNENADWDIHLIRNITCTESTENNMPKNQELLQLSRALAKDAASIKNANAVEQADITAGSLGMIDLLILAHQKEEALEFAKTMNQYLMKYDLIDVYLKLSEITKLLNLELELNKIDLADVSTCKKCYLQILATMKSEPFQNDNCLKPASASILQCYQQLNDATEAKTFFNNEISYLMLGKKPKVETALSLYTDYFELLKHEKQSNEDVDDIVSQYLRIRGKLPANIEHLAIVNQTTLSFAEFLFKHGKNNEARNALLEYRKFAEAKNGFIGGAKQINWLKQWLYFDISSRKPLTKQYYDELLQIAENKQPDINHNIACYIELAIIASMTKDYKAEDEFYDRAMQIIKTDNSKHHQAEYWEWRYIVIEREALKYSHNGNKNKAIKTLIFGIEMLHRLTPNANSICLEFKKPTKEVLGKSYPKILDKYFAECEYDSLISTLKKTISS